MHQRETTEDARLYHDYFVLFARQGVDHSLAQVDGESYETLLQLLGLSLCNGFRAHLLGLLSCR